ncbi:MAG: pimeloyl-ACP methyl ester carboxylesterase [Paraglaciecola sp.]|jgi:pimeloyl-ACP methyl ester carboxylesterase
MNKKLVRLLSTVLPNRMVNIAYNTFANPQVKKLRPHELEVLATAKQEDFDFKHFTIKTYQWGETGERILLIHGWEGQAGNFSELIHKLLTAGYQVCSFDAPSHGFSSSGKTSVLEFTELVAVMIRHFKVRKLISHSFGAVATTFSLFNNRDISIDKYVMLTTPDKFSERIDQIVELTGITEQVRAKLMIRLQKEMNVDLNHLNVSEWVKHINVTSGLIIHDRQDKVLSIQQAQNVDRNWPNAQLRIVEGTGHFRILRTDWVLNEAIAFLKKA